jgi:D-alanyl-D-alanine carboxypeptidase (penicillin-binding protein 5/6)
LLAASLSDSVLPLIQQHEGQVAVAIKHLATGERFDHQSDKPMPTASLIKLPIMMEAYRQAGEGLLDLQQRITLADADKVEGSGILTRHFSAGTQVSLLDAIRLMIAFSDNTATNLVIDRIGLPATAQTMEQLGCPDTKLHAKVFRADTSIFPDRSKQFGLGSTTAAEMISLLERIEQRQFAGPQACDAMIEHLRACQDRTKIARLLPDHVLTAHKSGEVAKSRTDAGLLKCSTGTIALCVLTTDNADQTWQDDNQANILCGQIAKAAYDYFQRADINTDSSHLPLAAGASNPQVELLQRTLNAKLDPSPELSIDGDFGPLTEAAVIRFQKSRGIEPSGIVDRETWRSLSPLQHDDLTVPPPEDINRQVLERQPADDVDGQPFVTCKAWAIVDGLSGEYLFGAQPDEPLDPASTTKIMTAVVILRLAEQQSDVLGDFVVMSERADQTIGSTADLRAGERTTALEMLHGLLLPSGNDVAVALAEHFGNRFREPGDMDGTTSGELFVREMNRTAKTIGLLHTTFKNPHGLTEAGHVISARDLAILGWHAMQQPAFRQVVGTRQRGCTVEGSAGYTRHIVWKNTNQLLGIEGYDGIKTGTTTAAGACLVSRSTRGDRSLILAVLGATSADARYTDTRNLYRWAWRELDKNSAGR